MTIYTVTLQIVTVYNVTACILIVEACAIETVTVYIITVENFDIYFDFWD